jgi:hypothetical protein
MGREGAVAMLSTDESRRPVVPYSSHVRYVLFALMLLLGAWLWNRLISVADEFLKRRGGGIAKSRWTVIFLTGSVLFVPFFVVPLAIVNRPRVFVVVAIAIPLTILCTRTVLGDRQAGREQQGQ